MLTGPDISNNQPSADLAAVAAAGHSFVIHKATEGVGFTDGYLSSRRDQAHQLGLTFGMYHFARATDAIGEANYFLGAVGDLRPGEFIVLDWEVSHPDPPHWCAQWMRIVKLNTGLRPLLYLNQSARDGYDWSAVIPDSLLWLAKYDGSTAPAPSGAWPSLTMKQFTDSGSVPGISGGVDLNAFYGDQSALNALGTPQEDDLTPDESLMLSQIHTILADGFWKDRSKPPFYPGEVMDRIDRAASILTRGHNDGSDRLDDEWALLQTILTKAGQGGAVDPAALAAAIAAALPANEAKAVADELAKRLSA